MKHGLLCVMKLFSKYWITRQLANIKPEISTMYILGAWYSNLALFLTKYQHPQVQHIINVETNKEFVQTGQELLNQFGADNVSYELKDANTVDYSQLDQNSAVVNTSLTDMPGRDWFDNIPSGVMVALQARDHDPGEQFAGPDDIQSKFPLSQVLYSGSLQLEDPETEYTRFMTIGIK